MKKITESDIDQIILMAWGDTILFETIEREYSSSESNLA
jgi:hypothetical protein